MDNPDMIPQMVKQMFEGERICRWIDDLHPRSYGRSPRIILTICDDTGGGLFHEIIIFDEHFSATVNGSATTMEELSEIYDIGVPPTNATFTNDFGRILGIEVTPHMGQEREGRYHCFLSKLTLLLKKGGMDHENTVEIKSTLPLA